MTLHTACILNGFHLGRYVGTHDFRNVCKMDVGNGVLQFQRTILAATIRPYEEHATGNPEDPYDLFIFEIKGLAFLYHQVSTHHTTTGIYYTSL